MFGIVSFQNVMSLKLHLDINPFSTQWENLICSPFLTFTRFSFHFRPSYLCISFPYNEVCHTILPLGNVRTHDVNVLVTNLFTTLLYLFMYTGLSIISLFTKRNSVFNSRFALIFWQNTFSRSKHVHLNLDITNFNIVNFTM